MYKKKKTFILLFILIMLSIASIILPDLIQAQFYWAALPPYNVLWPLWSPALSPGSPPVPLVTELTKSTILPVQPGLIWDPLKPYGTKDPWLIYNAPAALGSYLLYFDILYGLNAWPPSYLVDPITGLPKPITLPLGFSVYLPPALAHIPFLVPSGNAAYITQFGLPTTPFLSSAAIWGYTPLAALPPPIF